jgi:hypothetical protein
MKLYILISAFLMLSFSNNNKNYNDFDSVLTQIVDEFKSNIMNKNKCEDLKRKASYLSDEIQGSIADDQNSDYDKKKLVQLKKEVEAVEEFIGTVGNAGNNMFVEMDAIYLANNRINSSITTVEKDKFCAEIITISLNGYVATLALNNSSYTYTVAYKWKLSNANNTGNGTMGFPTKSVRHIYDNRSNPASKRITIISVSCKNI